MNFITTLVPSIVFILFFFTPSSLGTSYLHPGPIHPNTHANIHGHILSHTNTLTNHGQRKATVFNLYHRRPLLLWDELHENKIHLSVIRNEEEKSFTLRLQGPTLDLSDFEDQTVLCIHPLQLRQRHGLISDKHVYLSIDGLEKESDSKNSIQLKTTMIPPESVVSHVDFSIFTATIHQRVKNVRRLHIYGRHGPPLRTITNLEDNHQFLSSSSTRQFGLSPLEVCISSALFSSFNPITVCELQLTGTLFSKTIDLTPLIHPLSKVLPLSEDEEKPIGSFNSSISVFASGRFDVTEDKLNFTLNYSGSISAHVYCPIKTGCRLPSNTGLEIVADTQKLLKTTDGQFSLPSIPGFRIESDLELKYSSFLVSETSFSLEFEQPFQISSSAPGDIAKTEVLSPNNVESNVDENLIGKGPRGKFENEFVIRMNFEDSGTSIGNRLEFSAGERIKTFGDGSVGTFQRPKKWGDFQGTCNVCHERRVRFYPFMKNIVGIVNTTDTRIGFNEGKKNIRRVRGGRPLTVCLTPTTNC